jgi:hypothetical protein
MQAKIIQLNAHLQLRSRAYYKLGIAKPIITHHFCCVKLSGISRISILILCVDVF